MLAVGCCIAGEYSFGNIGNIGSNTVTWVGEYSLGSGIGSVSTAASSGSDAKVAEEYSSAGS